MSTASSGAGTGGAFAGGAPTGSGVRVQSGKILRAAERGVTGDWDSMSSSSSPSICASASSHFSLATSAPPVLSALHSPGIRLEIGGEIR